MAPLSICFFTFVLLSSLTSSSASLPPVNDNRCNAEDKKVLIKIRSEMGNPYDLIGWNTKGAGGCCQWYGVQCNTNGRVYALYFNQFDTAITIPASIGGLPFITSLSFHKNPKLTGPIPPVIGELTKLTSLKLDTNALTGPIPASLARLTSLDYLNLAFNQLSGSIPPFLGNLPLSYIGLDRNRLTGPIPASLAKTTSTYLYLSHNDLTGQLPSSFAATSIQVIDLSRNKLSGDPSLLFGATKPVTDLDLSLNLFQFDLTKVVFPKKLTTLDLSHNKVYGSIPKQIASLQGLYRFNVSYNMLCGAIPTGGRLGQFDQFSYLHNKCLKM